MTYLSPPHSVHVSEQYFLNADLEHFWVRRRFDVVRRLADSDLGRASEIGDIGCGHGLVQRQVELAYGRGVDGFDLNEYALTHSIAERGGVFCYDVHDRLAHLRQRYDVLLLLDVLEHIPDEDAFLDAVLFMLGPAGRLVVNVPGGPSLFSAYDRVQGHCRRYSLEQLRGVLERNGLRVVHATYWGLPLVPLAVIRRSFDGNEADVMRRGFLPPGRLANRLLGLTARAETIPQRLGGTSVMIVAEPASPVSHRR